MDYIDTDSVMLAETQSFLMGFYYAILIRLLDTSQLSVQQAFGSWGWYDNHMFYKVSDILRESRIEKTRHFHKHGVMRLLALFFAGVEEAQINLIVHGVVGVIGKLSLLTASLLGDADSCEKTGKFFLVDVDPTCIPSTARGIVVSTPQWYGLKFVNDSKSTMDTQKIKEVNLCGSGIVLTSHIEPDWDHDVQTCIVAFRYQGRLVRRISPTDCEYASLEDSPVSKGRGIGKAQAEVDNASSQQPLEEVLVPVLASYGSYTAVRVIFNRCSQACCLDSATSYHLASNMVDQHVSKYRLFGYLFLEETSRHLGGAALKRLRDLELHFRHLEERPQAPLAFD